MIDLVRHIVERGGKIFAYKQRADSINRMIGRDEDTLHTENT